MILMNTAVFRIDLDILVFLCNRGRVLMARLFLVTNILKKSVGEIDFFRSSKIFFYGKFKKIEIWRINYLESSIFCFFCRKTLLCSLCWLCNSILSGISLLTLWCPLFFSVGILILVKKIINEVLCSIALIFKPFYYLL